jgi:hypothetical protein
MKEEYYKSSCGILVYLSEIWSSQGMGPLAYR